MLFLKNTLYWKKNWLDHFEINKVTIYLNNFIFSYLFSIEPACSNTATPIFNHSYTSKKNTSVTNLKNSEVTKSNRSLSKTLSRSSSKEPTRSRNTSGQRSEQNSPRNFKKVVQYFTASQMMGNFDVSFCLKDYFHVTSISDLYHRNVRLVC